MPRLPGSERSLAARVGLTLGGGGAGWFGALAIMHRPSTAAIGVAVAACALAANSIRSICESLPKIIEAKGVRDVERIRAVGEATAHIRQGNLRSGSLDHAHPNAE